jgi:lipid-A-disaccharide synthase
VSVLAARRPDIQFALAAAPSLEMSRLESHLAGLPVRILSGHTHDVLASAAVALVASGTATVETALLETPMVVVYRVSAASYALGRRLVHVPHFAMVNLVAGRRIVPELIQGEFTPARVAEEALSLLQNPEKADTMRREFREVRRLLGEPGASGRAARVVLEALKS